MVALFRQEPDRPGYSATLPPSSRCIVTISFFMLWRKALLISQVTAGTPGFSNLPSRRIFSASGRRCLLQCSILTISSVAITGHTENFYCRTRSTNLRM